MADKSTPQKSSWWNHETDRSKLAELSTAFSALQRQQHSAGWRRNGLIMVGVVAFVAALKLFVSA